MSEEMKETMDDFKAELEASYKEYDQRKNKTEVTIDTPDAGKWEEIKQMQADKVVVNVKVREAVKGGVTTTLNDLNAFIPASQLSLGYVEKPEDYVGQHVEAYIITADPEKKRLVLSCRELLRERRAAEKQAKMAAVQVGATLTGTVESLKDYGAFVKLEEGVTGLLHVSQISTKRVKSPAAVLKEGQEVQVRVIAVDKGRISLSMRALEEKKEAAEEDIPLHVEYKSEGNATLGLGSLLKNIKL